MAAKYILGALSIVFLVLTVIRLARDGGRLNPQSKTWLFIGVVFAVVSAWLFSQQ
jgi:hypothetical protein